MLKIVIVDDEKNVRIVIKKLLTFTGIAYKVVGEAPAIAKAKEVILDTNPDVVLLDIKLDDGTGFELLKQLPKINFQVIFITAYNEYAIKAFKFSALDYILKPIDPLELKEAIIKADKSINSKKELDLLLKNLEDNNTDFEKLVIKTTQKTYFIAIEDIRYFQSDGSYTKVITKEYNVLASKNLKYFQEILPNNQFIRTHQSYLINKSHVSGLKTNAIMLGDIEIPISIRRKTEILKLLNN